MLLVAGFGWFANFRLYERDKKSLQQELTHTLSLEVSKAHNDLRKSSDEHIQKTLKSKLLRIDRDIRMIRVEQLRTEAKVWEEKGIKANALMTYIRMLTEAIEMDNLYVVSDTLDKVRELLLSKVTQIDAQLVADFNTVLSKLPLEYESEVQDLKQLLRTARE